MKKENINRASSVRGTVNGVRSALATHSPQELLVKTTRQQQETADDYRSVVVQLSERWRVVVCRDKIQWILQRRKNGGAERPWRGHGYFRTRFTLIRVCANSCGHIDPAALAALATLPELIGGVA